MTTTKTITTTIVMSYVDAGSAAAAAAELATAINAAAKAPLVISGTPHTIATVVS